jgi:hypothetical protein
MYIGSDKPNPGFLPFVLVTTDLALPLPALADCQSEADIFTNFGGSGLFSAGWKVVGLAADDMGISNATEKQGTTDGTQLLLSETVSFEANDYSTSEDNYTALRSEVHQTPCSVLLVDPSRCADGDGTVYQIKKIILDVASDPSGGQLKTTLSGEQKASKTVATIKTLV